jgi:endonuclease-3
MRNQCLTQIVAILSQVYPEARCRLEFSTPLELLVATILAAQCTDERVNAVTRTLFRKYHTAADYANTGAEELAQEIKSTGFYRQKAASLQRCCEALVRHHAGVVPDSLEALVQLPGVGRKTANVVLGNALHRSQGIAVDTHVKRVVQRLGLTIAASADTIEQDLMALVPQEHWTRISHLLIFHGRAVCKARVPRCAACPLQQLCPSRR